jgi:hypothetical protein
MILRQPVFTAELTSAVGTPERHKCFLPALLTIHACCVTLFSSIEQTCGLYVSLKKRKNHR